MGPVRARKGGQRDSGGFAWLKVRVSPSPYLPVSYLPFSLSLGCATPRTVANYIWSMAREIASLQVRYADWSMAKVSVSIYGGHLWVT